MLGRYIDEFIGLKCASQLLSLKFFPNGKEITESMAMYNAIRRFNGDHELGDRLDCVVVGDGHTPRTAALVAMRSNYRCYSVDPALRVMKIEKWEDKVNRLQCYSKRVEEISFNFSNHVFVLLPHSHVDILTCLKHLKAPSYTIITMDCCFDNSLSVPPDIEYVDNEVWSPQRTVKVWKDYSG